MDEINKMVKFDKVIYKYKKVDNMYCVYKIVNDKVKDSPDILIKFSDEDKAIEFCKRLNKESKIAFKKHMGGKRW